MGNSALSKVFLVWYLSICFLAHSEITSGAQGTNFQPIKIKVIPQFHPSPFAEDNNDVNKNAMVSICEDFTANTLKESTTYVKAAVVEGVYRKGSILKPENINDQDLLKQHNRRITRKISDYVQIYGFEEIDIHLSAVQLLAEMKLAVKSMRLKHESIKSLANRMQYISNEMQIAAENGKNSNENTNSNSSNSLVSDLNNELVLTKEMFEKDTISFNLKEREYFLKERIFKALSMTRSSMALQTAMQVAVNNNLDEVYIIIGSEHWENFVAIEKRINSTGSKQFILEKIEPNYGSVTQQSSQ
jgi:hypothetical protein